MYRAKIPAILALLTLSGAAFASGMGSMHMDPVPKREAAFIRENHTAMDKMMRAMAVKPSGDVDRDFVAMMTPHHQGAIDMAEAELRHGKNETLRRIAQEIIVTQQQEIAAMRRAEGEPLPPSTPSPTQVSGVSK